MESVAWKTIGKETSPCELNHWIAHTDTRFLGFYRPDRMDVKTLEDQVVSCGLLIDNTVVVYSAGGETDAEQLTIAQLLYFFDREIAAFVFDRSLLQNSSRWNLLLKDGAEYEFLCRLTEAAGFCIRIPVPINGAFRMSDDYADVCACLYWKYARQYDNAIQSAILERLCAYSNFLPAMQKVLRDPDHGAAISQNTAPIALIVESVSPEGTIRCYGVVRWIALQLAEGLRKIGEAVWVTSLETREDQVKLLSYPMKAVIGFQTSAMETKAISGLRAQKVQIWFDFPGLFPHLLHDLPADHYVLCQDSFHAEYIRRYCHSPNAFHFPLGGTDRGWITNTERPYDITFIGSCFEREPIPEEDQGWFDFLVEHPQLDYVTALLQWSSETALNILPEAVPDFFAKHKEATKSIPYEYRMRVVEKILCAGYKIHVYGSGWRNYNRGGAENLIIHEACSPEQSLEEYGKSKIALNVMSWHKGGMTERISNILLSGAVCLTDSTTYLAEHFRDGEELCLFSLDHLEKIPDIIAGLLRDETRRSQIAAAAYRRACGEYTWEHRAEVMIELLDGTK